MLYRRHTMDTISISQLKMNPSKAILDATQYPVAIESRNKVKAYLVGKEIYEKLISYIENFIDAKEVAKTDFSKGRDLEQVAKELGI